MKLSSLGEFGLIKEISKITGKTSKAVVKGIGDDTAVIDAGGGKYLLSTIDTLVEDVHFKPKYFSFYDLGWKALAVNLSDITSMGGIPKSALVSLALPLKTSVGDVKSFYKGMKALARTYNVDIVGGDTVSSPDKVYVSVNVLGDVQKKRLKLRSGARAGDLIMATGNFGGSALGLHSFRTLHPKPQPPNLKIKHLRPMPRVKEGVLIASFNSVSSMMDDSDGLAFTVAEICRQSGVGAELDETLIPKARGASLKDALYGGEDFELVFTCGAGQADRLAFEVWNATGTPVSVIGQITPKKQGIILIDGRGDRRPLSVKGYAHF